MKCSSCGREFGEGINCQYCGVDRVTGLGNYSGYDTSDYHGANTSHYNSSYNSSPKTMVCYACGEIIPINSEYCPYCRKKLYETCPQCGNTYSSQYHSCNKCGTNRADYYRESERNQHTMEKAKELRNEMKAEWIYAVMIPIGVIAWFIIWEWMGVENLEKTPIKKHVVLAAIVVVFCAVGKFLCTVITDWKIDKWKQEHPNDPRSKYL